MTIQIFKNLLEYKKRHELMNNNPFLNAYLQNGLEAVQDLLLANGESFDEIDNAARWAVQTNDDQLIDVFAKTGEGCFAKKKGRLDGLSETTAKISFCVLCRRTYRRTLGNSWLRIVWLLILAELLKNFIRKKTGNGNSCIL